MGQVGLLISSDKNIIMRLIHLIIFFFSIPAYGQSKAPEYMGIFAKCTVIEDSEERLACFDAFAKKYVKAPISNESPVQSNKARSSDKGKWKAVTNTSKIDDSRTVTLSIDGKNIFIGWPAYRHIPTIVVRCKEASLDVYLVTGMSAESSTLDGAELTLRFDKESAENFSVTASSSRDAYFFQRPAAMVDKFTEHRSLFVQFTPFNSNPTSSTFDIAGLTGHLESLRKSCPS